MKLKKGMKIRRIKQNSVSCDVFVGKIYTVLSFDEKWVMLKERTDDGLSWLIKNFEVA